MRRIALSFLFVFIGVITIYGQNLSELDHEVQSDITGLKFCVRNGKCGYIDAKGNEVIPIKYDYDRADFDVHEGKYPLDENCGYVEDWRSSILVRVKQNGKYGFVNHKGEEVIPLKYDMLYDGHFVKPTQLVKARIGDKYGLINISGQEVIPIKYKNTGNCDYGNYNGPTWVQRDDGKIAYVEYDGSFITDFKYTEASESFNGDSKKVARVAVNGLWGFIDKQGNEVITPKYKYAGLFASEDGWISVVKDNKLGFIDVDENVVIPFIYDVATYDTNEKSLTSDFSNGNAYVRKNGKWGLINKKGTAITPFKYDNISSGGMYWGIGYYMAKVGGKTVYIDILGAEYDTREKLKESYMESMEKAANMGIGVAAKCLARMYDSGEFVPKDSKKSFEWYKKAVEMGYLDAEYDLALKYYYGEGCEKDYESAYRLMRSALVRGNNYASKFLGYMYYYGQGIEENSLMAYVYFNLSTALLNDHDSQYHLAWLYEHGQGVGKNIEEAKKWYEQSAFYGYQPAKDQLAKLLNKHDDESPITDNIATMTWMAFESMAKTKDYSFKIGIKSDSKIEDISVYVNGVLTRGIVPVVDDGYNMTIDRTVALDDGQNTIKIMVKNAGGVASSEKVVTYQNQDIATIDWLAFVPTTTDKQYTVKAGIKSISKIESWTVTINGIVDRGINPVKNDGYTMAIEKKLILAEGNNTIKIEVKNAGGIAMIEKNVIYTAKKEEPVIQQKRIALVMGNANYQDVDKRLKNPVNDATDVAERLESLDFKVIRSLDQTRQGMEAAINDFGNQARNYEVALFYYAGHGVSCNGNNYLIPIDANLPEESYVQYNCTNTNLVLDLMEKARCPMKIMILDACRNNPFARSWNRDINGGGLNVMNASQGTFIAFSTAPGNVAQDGAERNSPYTAAFLQTLDIPNLSLTDFFQEVLEKVALKTKDKQIPWTSNSFRGKFYFNKK